MYPVTAADEILKRIKALDLQEATMRRQASNRLAEAAKAEAEAERLATLRRQYEYAFTQLGGEFPGPPSPAVNVPVRHGGRLIGQLG